MLPLLPVWHRFSLLPNWTDLGGVGCAAWGLGYLIPVAKYLRKKTNKRQNVHAEVWNFMNALILLMDRQFIKSSEIYLCPGSSSYSCPLTARLSGLFELMCGPTGTEMGCLLYGGTGTLGLLTLLLEARGVLVKDSTSGCKLSTSTTPEQKQVYNSTLCQKRLDWQTGSAIFGTGIHKIRICNCPNWDFKFPFFLYRLRWSNNLPFPKEPESFYRIFFSAWTAGKQHEKLRPVVHVYSKHHNWNPRTRQKEDASRENESQRKYLCEIAVHNSRTRCDLWTTTQFHVETQI